MIGSSTREPLRRCFCHCHGERPPASPARCVRPCPQGTRPLVVGVDGWSLRRAAAVPVPPFLGRPFFRTVVHVASLDTRARWFRWGAFLAGLTALSFFTMVQLLLGYWGKGLPLTIHEAFLSGLATWYPWAVFAPM